MPKDQAAFDQEIAALGEVDSFGTKKEIKYLPEILKEAEAVKALASGMMDGNTWLLCVTDQRLLFLDKGMITGLKQTEIPLGSITSVNQKTGLIMGSITVTTAGKEKKIDSMIKKDVPRVAAIISDLMDQIAKESTVSKSSAGSAPEELARWKELLDDGTITEDEFNAKKKQLLGL